MRKATSITWLTREIPVGAATNSTSIYGVLKGVHSEYFYKSIEASADGIIDFKIEEEGKNTRDLMRIRSMRNVHFDRGWHELKLGDNFQVTLEK
jgi:KaiC/GvpD/RAD55 family RecA-like ATPase